MSDLKTILISSYLGLEEGVKKLRYFERLDAVLRARGYRLFVVSTHSKAPKTTCDGVHVPLFIVKGHRFRLGKYVEPGDMPADVLEAASIDAEHWQRNVASEAVRVLFYRAYLRGLIKQTRPALCVFWHQYNSLHHSMKSLCDEMGAPMLWTEYGLLPGTIQFDAEGQMAESWVARESQEFLELPVDSGDPERASRVLEYVRANQVARKQGGDDVSVEEVVARIRGMGRKIIFYAGQHDYKSGMAPRTLANAELHSPYFESTGDALGELSRVAEELDAHVLYKPHPLAGAEGAADLDRVETVAGANLFECMNASDVVVTILSQVSYMAMIFDRPCVLLGRNPLSGKGCAHEIDAREETGQAVRTGLDEGLSDARRDAWQKHVAQLCRHALFSFDEAMEAEMGRAPEEAAAYLVGQCTEGEPGTVGRAPDYGADWVSGRSHVRLDRRYRFLNAIDPILLGTLARLGKI